MLGGDDVGQINEEDGDVYSKEWTTTRNNEAVLCNDDDGDDDPRRGRLVHKS